MPLAHHVVVQRFLTKRKGKGSSMESDGERLLDCGWHGIARWEGELIITTRWPYNRRHHWLAIRELQTTGWKPVEITETKTIWDTVGKEIFQREEVLFRSGPIGLFRIDPIEKVTAAVITRVLDYAEGWNDEVRIAWTKDEESPTVTYCRAHRPEAFDLLKQGRYGALLQKALRTHSARKAAAKAQEALWKAEAKAVTYYNLLLKVTEAHDVLVYPYTIERLGRTLQITGPNQNQWRVYGWGKHLEVEVRGAYWFTASFPSVKLHYLREFIRIAERIPNLREEALLAELAS